MKTDTTENSPAGQPEILESRVVAADSRRNFIRRGVSVAVPTILTLASRSALACHCRSPSAQGSLAGSQTHGRTDFSATPPKTYREWMQAAFLPSGIQKTSKLKALFPYFEGQTDGELMIKKLTNQFQKDLVTAYLNISYIPIVADRCLSIAQIQAMAGGSYTPVAGSSITWDQAQIQEYLRENYLLNR